jgi:hypothetical protein
MVVAMCTSLTNDLELGLDVNPRVILIKIMNRLGYCTIFLEVYTTTYSPRSFIIFLQS